MIEIANKINMACNHIVNNCYANKKEANINSQLENILNSNSNFYEYVKKFDPKFIKYKNIHHISINTSIETELEANEIKSKHVDLAFKREKQIVVVEVKKIYTNTEGSDYPYLFSDVDDQNKLLSTNFYDLGKSMLLSHRGFEIITHYQEGQIVHDIMRLLNFERSGFYMERYIVCFVQNNTSDEMKKPTIPDGKTLVKRLKTVLGVAQKHFKTPVFTDGYGRTFSQLQDSPDVRNKFDNPVYALRTPKPGMSFKYKFSNFGENEFYANKVKNFMACVIKITPDFPLSKA
ncbi:MAG: hypothetical protein FIA89_15440 [Geobacter sp.]|nr:hypothetical protein [Geobacter sp.]